MSPRLTADQDAERLSGLGASDVAALAGVSPWKTPFDLYLEKIGELDPRARESDKQLERMERGHRLEDVALQWDAEITGEHFERVHRTIWHPRIPFLFAHPDARRKPWRKTRRLVEAKTSARRWDEVPQHVEAQVQMQMATTGAEGVDVVVLGFDGPPHRFPVERNEELIAALEGLATDFWDRVQRRDPPPMDGSRDVGRWLDGMFREAPEIQADADQARILARLLELRAQANSLEAEDRELVNVLKFSLAGASRLYARGVGSVLWTAPSARRTVAWKDVAFELGETVRALVVRHPELQADLDALEVPDPETVEAAHTRTDEGVRQFRITPAKSREEVA